MDGDAAFQFNVTSAMSLIATDEIKAEFLKQANTLSQRNETKVEDGPSINIPDWKEIDTVCRLGQFSAYEPRWLNIKMHSNWYMFYAEYYFETWVTSTADPNGPRVTVPSLELKWRYGDTRGVERGANVTMVSKSERLYVTSVFGPGEMCSHGLCTDDQGGTGFVSTPNACIWA